MNIGEENCGEYLRWFKGCDFVQYNTKLIDAQGEIDVVGINLADRIVCACEVATHLVLGLQYVKNKRPDNVDRLTRKFEKDFDYLEKLFPDYEKTMMLWSPIVKNQKPGSKYNQCADVRRIADRVKKSKGVAVQMFINESCQEVLMKLREIAGGETKELGSFMRYMQIEEYLKRHVARISKSGRR